jgi:3'-phosphoadenosine 5'-phosphosulfate sulfotransferase (PAPS reductase)/FAD synthetase
LLDIWKPNYYEITQEVDYIELCKTIGLPHERTKIQQKKAVQQIKKNVLDEFAINHSFDLCFWGIRCDESKGRSMLYRKNGFFVKSTEIHKCHPIALISQQQLWYFYEKYEIPVNQIYTKTMFLSKFQIRNTGWLSTDGAEQGKIAWLNYYYPDFYNKLKQNFNVSKNI